MLLVLLAYNLALSEFPVPLSPSIQMAQAPSVRILEPPLSLKLHIAGFAMGTVPIYDLVKVKSSEGAKGHD